MGPVLIAQISPAKEIGFRIGLLLLISSVGGLTTGPIAGAIVAHSNGSFIGMKIFAGVLCLAGTTVVLAARLHATGPKLLAKF